MLHINLICIGKIKEKFFKDAIDEYSKRLNKYCNLKIIELPDEKIPANASDKEISIIKNKEAQYIISSLKNDSYVIAFDLRGSQFSSEGFAQKLNNISINCSSTISFIIGGSLGLSENILNISDEIMSFSKMTFPHQLFRVLLLEQTYRAFKILNNETYHK